MVDPRLGERGVGRAKLEHHNRSRERESKALNWKIYFCKKFPKRKGERTL
jgi:hypothetical protein